MIIASAPLEDIVGSRPRLVDSKAARGEREQWKNWHDEQTSAEEELRQS
jgi:hypothetical protein